MNIEGVVLSVSKNTAAVSKIIYFCTKNLLYSLLYYTLRILKYSESIKRSALLANAGLGQRDQLLK